VVLDTWVNSVSKPRKKNYYFEGERAMNVLSLFDGMSCGQIALERAGIKVDNYFASEIDKYAIKVTQANYPNTIQLGDITKWREWDLPKIDLILAGSPCQGFSFAGKQLAFDDPRSKLFFTFVDIKNYYKPEYYLLENVKMKQEFQDIISEAVGNHPYEINSSLVSAQNRRRDYWTNWLFIEPEDKGILLKDILEDGVVDKDKSYCLDANYFKGGNLKQYFEKHRRQLVFSKGGLCHVGEADIKGNDQIRRVYHPDGKSPCLDAMGGGNREPKVLIEPPFALTERRTEEAKKIRREFMAKYGRDYSPRRAKELVPRTDGKMNCLTATYSTKEHTVICRATVQKNSEHNKDGKSTALTAAMGMGGGNVPMPMPVDDAANFKGKYLDGTIRHQWRKLTPLECERLQTVPDNYTNHVSNTQRYKMLGNGWTVDVIVHILKGLK
jgi:DNA-cytosine methyltransferase